MNDRKIVIKSSYKMQSRQLSNVTPSQSKIINYSQQATTNHSHLISSNSRSKAFDEDQYNKCQNQNYRQNQNSSQNYGITSVGIPQIYNQNNYGHGNNNSSYSRNNSSNYSRNNNRDHTNYGRQNKGDKKYNKKFDKNQLYTESIVQQNYIREENRNESSQYNRNNQGRTSKNYNNNYYSSNIKFNQQDRGDKNYNGNAGRNYNNLQRKQNIHTNYRSSSRNYENSNNINYENSNRDYQNINNRDYGNRNGNDGNRNGNDGNSNGNDGNNGNSNGNDGNDGNSNGNDGNSNGNDGNDGNRNGNDGNRNRNGNKNSKIQATDNQDWKQIHQSDNKQKQIKPNNNQSLELNEQQPKKDDQFNRQAKRQSQYSADISINPCDQAQNSIHVMQQSKGENYSEQQSSDWEADQQQQQSQNQNEDHANQNLSLNMSQFKNNDISHISIQDDPLNVANMSINQEEDDDDLKQILHIQLQKNIQKMSPFKHNCNHSKNQFQQIKLSDQCITQSDQETILQFLSKIYQDQDQGNQPDKINLQIEIQSTSLSKIWIRKISLPCFGIKNYKIAKNNIESQLQNSKFVTFHQNFTAVLNNIDPLKFKQNSRINLCNIIDPYQIIKQYQNYANQNEHQEQIYDKMKSIVKKMNKILSQMEPKAQNIQSGQKGSSSQQKSYPKGLNFLKIQQVKISCRACYTKSQPLFLNKQNFLMIYCQKCELQMTVEITHQKISGVAN